MYRKVIDEALEALVRDYSAGVYIPLTEADVQGYLFTLCINKCVEYNLDKDIHLNCRHQSLGSREKIDLVAGGKVVCEIKFEADFPGVSKPVVFHYDVRKDLKRIENLSKQGFDLCYFIFLDEDGEHHRNSLKRYYIEQSEWRETQKNDKKSFLLIHRVDSLMPKFNIKEKIRSKLKEVGGQAEIQNQKKGTFYARLVEEGIVVNNLGGSPLIKWEVFDELERLFSEKGPIVRKGDAMSCKLGEIGLSLDTIEGCLANKVYHKKIGDSVFRRITPISGILVWAGICRNVNGSLELIEGDR